MYRYTQTHTQKYATLRRAQHIPGGGKQLFAFDGWAGGCNSDKSGKLLGGGFDSWMEMLVSRSFGLLNQCFGPEWNIFTLNFVFWAFSLVNWKWGKCSKGPELDLNVYLVVHSQRVNHWATEMLPDWYLFTSGLSWNELHWWHWD